MPLNKTCFCGADKNFSSCCQSFIEQKTVGEFDQQITPKTPEQLMRSRFSAYVMGNGQYIYDTYAKSSQLSQSVKEINDWSQTCTWIALQIHSILPLNKRNDVAIIQSSEQHVEFSAFYIEDEILYELRENSRFTLENIKLESIKLENSPEIVNQNLQWRYNDGEIIKHCELAKVKRKELCPCNKFPSSWTIKKGKKYKQCCGN